ncbi:MAG: hypothetical protein LBI14_07640, partial [Treponema sp.]|nr:hypothetical protein [Treponema sp.]
MPKPRSLFPARSAHARLKASYLSRILRTLPALERAKFFHLRPLTGRRQWFPHSLLILLLVLPVCLFSQEIPDSFSGTIPEALLLPLRGEVPRYPRDMVIGALGQGTVPDGAWSFANNFISALMARQTGNAILVNLNSRLVENYFFTLDTINPLKYHLGSGRMEPDGTFSFLVRFLGREQWIAGELYLRMEGNSWLFDDLILEEGR